MSEIKARIDSLGRLVEIGSIDGIKLSCQLPMDFLDKFYNYKPTVSEGVVTALEIIDEYIDWQEPTRYQIKMSNVQFHNIIFRSPETMIRISHFIDYYDGVDSMILYADELDSEDTAMIKFFGGKIVDKKCSIND